MDTITPDPDDEGARERAAAYGDHLGAMPEGPAKELAMREYWLTVATTYSDHARVAELTAEIAALRRDHPDLP